MNAVFDYYQLARPDEGVDSGFAYATAPHITSTNIANDEPPKVETLYDRPLSQGGRTRVSGPFTVEAVPAPAVRSFDDSAMQRNPPTTASPAAARHSVRATGATSCSRPVSGAKANSALISQE
jgi:adenine-specific DNA-methyltransferase